MKDISVCIADENKELCHYLERLLNMTEGLLQPDMVLMSREMVKKVVQAFQHLPVHDNEEIKNLSNREKEILEHLSRGLMYKEIAADLYISTETVRKHVNNIYEKLHVNNRVAAVNKFFNR